MAARTETGLAPLTRWTRVRRGVLGGLATTLSQAACPPVLAALMLGIAAGAAGEPGAWRYAALFVGLGIATPLLYLVYLAKRGLVSDLDVQKRHQRWRPLLAALLGMTGGVALMAGWGAPDLMLTLAAALLVYTALAFAITLGWKISMHSAAAGALAMFCTHTFGANALPLAFGIPVMAWARVYLKRHTVAQTIAGAVLGSVVFWVAFRGVA